MNKQKNNSGQALIEMAAVLPVLLMMVLGVFEFSRAFFQMQALSFAAEAAAVAAVKADAAYANSVANQTAVNLLPAFPNLTVQVEIPPSSALAEPLMVHISARFQSLVGFFPGLQDLTLRGSGSAFYANIGRVRSTSLPTSS